MTELPIDSLPVPPTTTAIRPLYWSVQRELWENRSLFIAPLAVAGVFLFGFLISMFTLPHRMRTASPLNPAKLSETISMPYSAIAGLLMITAFIVGAFYCLDALHGERRDRSILFWKSLPVSDRTAVLSKASIPLMILPLFIFGIIISIQLIMLMLSTTVLLADRAHVATLWTSVKFFQSSLALLYGLTVIALWHAPIYGWLLLISAWARRAPVLWAVIPLLAIAGVERIIFNTTYVFFLLGDRMIGWFRSAFSFVPKTREPMEPLAYLTPGKFLSTPGLWIGLVFAAVFLATAVWLRRYKEPI